MARKRYQRGSLRREGDKWVLRWREDEVGDDNQPVRVARRKVLGSIADLPTKPLARRAADRVIEHVNALDYQPGKVATVEEFAAIYDAEIGPTLKPSARRAVQMEVRNYLAPTLGRYKLYEITGRVPQLVVTAMSQRKGKPPLERKTIKNALGTLGALLKAARAWGYMAERLDWSLVRLPTANPEAEVRAFTPSEAQRLIDAAPAPWHVAFALMAYLGIRTGETLALCWEHVDFDEAVVRIRRSAWNAHVVTVKSKSSRRDLPLPPVLVEMLEEHRRQWKPNPSGLLFANRKGTVIGSQYVRRKVLHPLRERLGIPRGAFHAFRHGHATTMFSAGATNPKVVQDQLGHADIGMTMRYTHAVPSDRRAAVERATEALLQFRRGDVPGGAIN